MKLDIDTTLITQFLEALETPHITVMVGVLGALYIIGRIFIAYVKASKE